MKNLLLSLFLFLFLQSSFGQATFTSIVNGNWTSAATWSFTGSDVDGIPDSDDAVVIAEGTNITISSAVNCASFSSTFNDVANTYSASIRLNSGGNLTISGTTNITDGPNIDEKFLIQIYHGSAVLTFNGPTTFSTTTDGKVDIKFLFNGAVHFNGATALNATNFSYGGFTGKSGTIYFNNSNKLTIPVIATSLFPNISISTSDTILLGNDIPANKIAGNFEILSGVFSTNGYALNGASSKSFKLSSGCTLIISGTSSYPNFSTNILESGTHVIYSGSNQNVAAKDYSQLTISGTGTKTLLGTGSLSNALFLNSSTLDLNNQNFTFKSTLNSHAMLFPNGGTIINPSNLVFERFVETEGYSIIGIPANGAEIEDLDDDMNLYNMTGATPGGGFSNWFSYIESSSSFDSPANTNSLLNLGTGYLTYIENGNLTLDISGRAPLTSTSLSVSGLNKNGDGFGFIANPYNAPVGFDVDNMFNLVAAGYKVNVTKDGYDPMIAASNPTFYMSPWQGIWVQSTGSNGSYTFNTSDIDKNEIDNFNDKSNYQEDNLSKDLLEFNLIDNNRVDIHYLKATEDATDGFDPKYDLEKFNNIPGQANLITRASGINLSVNTLAYDSSYKEIEFIVFTDFPSNTEKNYQLVIKPSKNLNETNTCYKLTDLKTGTTYPITNGEITVEFSQNDSISSPRFKLIYQKPITVVAQDLTCFQSNDGQLIAFNPTNESLTYKWYKNNDIIKTHSTNTNDTIRNLNAGQYTLQQEGNAHCPSIRTSVAINQPAKPNISYTLSTDTVNFDINETVDLNILADTAINFTVELQNGPTFTNQNSISISTYTTGANYIYIEFSDSNCTSFDTLTYFAISSSSVVLNQYYKANYKAYLSHGVLTVEDLSTIENQFDAKLFDAMGRIVFQQNDIKHFVSEELSLPKAIYFLEILDKSGRSSFTLVN